MILHGKPIIMKHYAFVEFSRLMFPNSFTGNRKMEKDHLNINIDAALLFIMPVYYLVIYRNVCNEDNKLKIYPRGMAT